MLIDMHSHSDGNAKFIGAQQANHIASILNATTTDEFQFNQQYAGMQQLVSYGVHPWESERQVVDQQLLATAPIIGEIGLDTEWTDVPLTIQRPVFMQQLQAAQQQHKPVILHTKGCEAEILAILKAYPQLTILVHWYSSKLYQDEYVRRPNSYFSIGPDVLTDPVVQKFAKKVAPTQLFIESDGLESFTWVLNRTVDISEYAIILKSVYQKVAQLRSITLEKLEEQIQMNWQQLLSTSIIN
jgi:TatD DNase family protein